FLSTWAYLRALDGPEGARRRWLVATTAGFAAALLSKGSALPFPAALLLLDVYPLRRRRRLGWWPLIAEKIPMLVVAGGVAVVMAYASRHGAALTAAADYPAVARLSVAAYGVVISAVRFIWPAALSPLYEM